MVKVQALVDGPTVRVIELHHAWFDPNCIQVSEKEYQGQNNFRSVDLPIGERTSLGLSEEAYELILALQGMLVQFRYKDAEQRVLQLAA